MRRVIVIGGGAAGMAAAIQAAAKGNQVILLEKNEKLGKKLFITGKGRCNLTNDCDMEDFFGHVMRNGKFLYSACYSFSNSQVVNFFEERGLVTKVERGGRVFPESDRSSDVIRVLQKALRDAGVSVRLEAEVVKVFLAPDGRGGRRSQAGGVILKDGTKIEAEAVVIATGGCSYTATGSDGDGYRFAEGLGHTVSVRHPSLVPMEAAEGWVRELQGLSLKNVTLRMKKGKKLLFEEFGEMLFTHYGVSGPLVLSASSVANDSIEHMPLRMEIDLKPALPPEQLDKRILRDFGGNQNRQFKNALQKLFPAKLIPIMVELSGIPSDKKVNEITREERGRLAGLIKALPITISRFRGFDEAIVTRGGVLVREVNPSTMESKLVQGLYFAGEVLDVDALTGGFNLQIAWSTGFLAGDSIA